MFQPVSSLPKRGRKCQEDDTQSKIIKNNTLKLAHGKQLDLSTTGTETQKNVSQCVSVGHRQKRAISSTASDSVVLRECSTINHQHGASNKSEKNLENKLLSSSSDSVTLRPSLAESHLSIQILERNAPIKENLGDSSSIIAEPSNSLRAKLKDPSNVSMNLI
jgi:hypothetical protein